MEIQNQLTPEQALQNLSKAAELVHCDGPTRDNLRECVKILSEVIAPKPPAPAG